MMKATLFAVFGTVTVVILILSLILRAKLTKRQAEFYELKAELHEIESESRRLMIELEERTDLAETEAYARNVLGMQTPYPWQRQSLDDGEEFVRYK